MLNESWEHIASRKGIFHCGEVLYELIVLTNKHFVENETPFFRTHHTEHDEVWVQERQQQQQQQKNKNDEEYMTKT